jgi:multidrug resistance efflux pump
LLEEGEDLVEACKQKMIKRDLKLQELKKLIRQKDSKLENKKAELSRLQNLLNKDSDGSNTMMKSYIFNSKLKTVKIDIKRLRNEKLNLEANELEYAREIDHLKSRLREMKAREKDEVSEVRSLKNKVGTISDKIKDDIERHSMVASNRDKLQTVLEQELENKKKL